MAKAASSNELKLQVLKLAGDLTLAALRTAKTEKIGMEKRARQASSLLMQNYDAIAEKVGLLDEPHECPQPALIVVNAQKPETIDGDIVQEGAS